MAKAKKKAAKKAKKKSCKPASAAKCLTKSGKLKKGCKYGRGGKLVKCSKARKKAKKR